LGIIAEKSDGIFDRANLPVPMLEPVSRHL
jgi:hypothetical protein